MTDRAAERPDVAPTPARRALHPVRFRLPHHDLPMRHSTHANGRAHRRSRGGPPMTKLREQMTQDMVLRGLALNTQHA